MNIKDRFNKGFLVEDHARGCIEKIHPVDVKTSGDVQYRVVTYEGVDYQIPDDIIIGNKLSFERLSLTVPTVCTIKATIHNPTQFGIGDGYNPNYTVYMANKNDNAYFSDIFDMYMWAERGWLQCKISSVDLEIRKINDGTQPQHLVKSNRNYFGTGGVIRYYRSNYFGMKQTTSGEYIYIYLPIAIYENNVLTHLYYPAKNSSNQSGLYDIIGKSFITVSGSTLDTTPYALNETIKTWVNSYEDTGFKTKAAIKCDSFNPQNSFKFVFKGMRTGSYSLISGSNVDCRVSSSSRSQTFCGATTTTPAITAKSDIIIDNIGFKINNTYYNWNSTPNLNLLTSALSFFAANVYCDEFLVYADDVLVGQYRSVGDENSKLLYNIAENRLTTDIKPQIINEVLQVNPHWRLTNNEVIKHSLFSDGWSLECERYRTKAANINRNHGYIHLYIPEDCSYIVRADFSQLQNNFIDLNTYDTLSFDFELTTLESTQFLIGDDENYIAISTNGYVILVLNGEVVETIERQLVVGKRYTLSINDNHIGINDTSYTTNYSINLDKYYLAYYNNNLKFRGYIYIIGFGDSYLIPVIKNNRITFLNSLNLRNYGDFGAAPEIIPTTQEARSANLYDERQEGTDASRDNLADVLAAIDVTASTIDISNCEIGETPTFASNVKSCVFNKSEFVGIGVFACIIEGGYESGGYIGVLDDNGVLKFKEEIDGPEFWTYIDMFEVYDHIIVQWYKGDDYHFKFAIGLLDEYKPYSYLAPLYVYATNNYLIYSTNGAIIDMSKCNVTEIEGGIFISNEELKVKPKVGGDLKIYLSGLTTKFTCNIANDGIYIYDTTYSWRGISYIIYQQENNNNFKIDEIAARDAIMIDEKFINSNDCFVCYFSTFSWSTDSDGCFIGSAEKLDNPTGLSNNPDVASDVISVLTMNNVAYNDVVNTPDSVGIYKDGSLLRIKYNVDFDMYGLNPGNYIIKFPKQKTNILTVPNPIDKDIKIINSSRSYSLTYKYRSKGIR